MLSGLSGFASDRALEESPGRSTDYFSNAITVGIISPPSISHRFHEPRASGHLLFVHLQGP